MAYREKVYLRSKFIYLLQRKNIFENTKKTKKKPTTTPTPKYEELPRPCHMKGWQWTRTTRCNAHLSVLLTVSSDKYKLSPSAGFSYRLDRLKSSASKLRGLRPRCMLFLTLLFDFHTCAVITYCTVALHFRILQNLKHSSLSSPLFKLIKHTSIFLQSWRRGIGGASQVE